MAVRLKEETRRDFWEQIVVSPTEARMHYSVFLQLPERDAPPVVRVGERWRYHNGRWWMGERQRLPGRAPWRGMTDVRWRKIIIVPD